MWTLLLRKMHYLLYIPTWEDWIPFSKKDVRRTYVLRHSCWPLGHGAGCEWNGLVFFSGTRCKWQRTRRIFFGQVYGIFFVVVICEIALVLALLFWNGLAMDDTQLLILAVMLNDTFQNPVLVASCHRLHRALFLHVYPNIHTQTVFCGYHGNEHRCWRGRWDSQKSRQR